MAKDNQHFIPQLYLRLFTDPKTPVMQTPYVWIFDKKGHTIKNKGTRNFAYIRGYNNIIDKNGKISKIVEDQFEIIETKAAPIIKKLINLKYIDRKERIELSKFICAMRLRVPYFKYTFKEAIEVKEYREQIDKYIKNEDISSDLRMDSVIRTVNLASSFLLRMKWSLLIAPKESDFITSDNPVVVLDPEASKLRMVGFTYSKETKIIFPLNPKVCLYGSWKKNKRLVEHLDKNNVDELNFEIYKYSYDYLYSSTKYLDKRILMVNAAINQGLIK